MTSLHTKLKELRELRERAVEGKWTYVPESNFDDQQIHNEEFICINQYDVSVPISPNDADFFICVFQLMNFFFTPSSHQSRSSSEDSFEMSVPCSKEDVVRVGTISKELLAEIAEMLERKSK